MLNSTIGRKARCEPSEVGIRGLFSPLRCNEQHQVDSLSQETKVEPMALIQNIALLDLLSKYIVQRAECVGMPQ